MKATPPQKRAPEDGNLAMRMTSLSSRRQQIIRPVLANPRQFVLLSVRDLASALETDAATIVRIVRGMGFDNYRAFQHHLHEVSIAYATSLDTMQASPVRKNGGAALIRESSEQDLKNLGAFRNSMDPEAIPDGQEIRYCDRDQLPARFADDRRGVRTGEGERGLLCGDCRFAALAHRSVG